MSSLTRTLTRARIRRQMEEYGIAHPCRKQAAYENTSYFSRTWKKWRRLTAKKRRNRNV